MGKFVDATATGMTLVHPVINDDHYDRTKNKKCLHKLPI
jgi:hypothetical protein